MAQTISFNPQVGDSLRWASRSSDTDPRLAPDLVQEVPRRLTLLASLVLVTSAVSEGLALVMDVPMSPSLRYGSLAVLVLAAVAILYVARGRRLSPRQFLNLAVVFEIIWAGTESTVIAQVQREVSLAGTGVIWSSVAVIVLIYPMIVPNTTRRILLGSVVAAATEPLAVIVAAQFGTAAVPDSLGIWVAWLWPHAVAITVAVVVSRIMYRLGERLTRARELGSYRLERLLGEGGMGQVWRASHRLLPRSAAVKLVRPEALSSSDPAAAQRSLARFEREAHATALLRSPHSVELFDYGIAGDGTFYYVMELLDGIDLQSLVDSHGPQPPERVVTILRQACHSLYEAHERGLLHRDIKPSNVFLCRYGMDVDFVKVLDFGLVKAAEAEETSDAKLTMEKRVVGTPAFMAPEAVAGGEELDARSDIYGLGCVAYWLLTGRLVFEKISPTEMMRAHLKDDPAPIATHRPDVPETLDHIVLQCLGKSVDERPPTARELDRLLGELDLDARWTLDRAEQWWEEWECGMGRRGS